MWPADKEKDEDRLSKSGTVLKQILDIPDDVPRDLLATGSVARRYASNNHRRQHVTKS